MTCANVVGSYTVEHYRPGDGVLATISGNNSVTVQGLRKLLSVVFCGETKVGQWYLGLIASGTLNKNDTLASNSFVRFADYSGTTCPAWGPRDATLDDLSVYNVTLLPFTCTAGGTVSGIYVSSTAVKASTSSSETLWATALFEAPISVLANDVLRISYSVSMER